MENFVYFGYDRLNAYMNMAIDEALSQLAHESRQTFVRFYDFDRPAVILAHTEHPSDVICNPSDGFDVTRRLSNGSVILCDENTLAYSITGERSEYKGPTEMHRIFGTRIGIALKNYLKHDDVSIGEHFSVRVDDKTIAGHGQHVGKSILYHGVLAVNPWDMEKISHAIRLREGEYEFIEALPAVAHYSEGTKKEQLVNEILDSITQGNYRAIDPALKENVISNATQRAAFYRSDDWIQFGIYHDKEQSRHLLQNHAGLGFCFADFITPEKEKTKL